MNLIKAFLVWATLVRFVYPRKQGQQMRESLLSIGPHQHIFTVKNPFRSDNLTEEFDYQIQLMFHTDLMNLWMKPEATIFTIFNYTTGIVDTLANNNTNSTSYKILLIPLAYKDQEIVSVPDPQNQSADLYIVEIPNFVGNQTNLIYEPDPWTSQNATIMLESSVFQNLSLYLTSHLPIQTQFEIEFTFECSTIVRDYMFELYYSFIFSVSLIVLTVYYFIIRKEIQLLGRLLIAVLLVLLTKQCLNMVMLSICPWTLQTSTLTGVLTYVLLLVEFFIQTYILLCLVMLIVGYQIIHDQINGWQFKFVVCTVTINFIVNQIELIFRQYPNVQQILFYYKIFLALILFTLTVYFMFKNICSLASFLNFIQINQVDINQEGRALVNKIKFRINLLIVSYTTLIIYFLVIFISGFFLIYVKLQNYDEVSTDVITQYIRYCEQFVKDILISFLALIVCNVFDRPLNTTNDSDATETSFIIQNFQNPELNRLQQIELIDIALQENARSSLFIPGVQLEVYPDDYEAKIEGCTLIDGEYVVIVQPDNNLNVGVVQILPDTEHPNQSNRQGKVDFETTHDADECDELV